MPLHVCVYNYVVFCVQLYHNYFTNECTIHLLITNVRNDITILFCMSNYNDITLIMIIGEDSITGVNRGIRVRPIRPVS